MCFIAWRFEKRHPSRGWANRDNEIQACYRQAIRGFDNHITLLLYVLKRHSKIGICSKMENAEKTENFYVAWHRQCWPHMQRINHVNIDFLNSARNQDLRWKWKEDWKLKMLKGTLIGLIDCILVCDVASPPNFLIVKGLPIVVCEMLAPYKF